MTYTHMLFILTYFHMYQKINVLQDIYKNTMELQSKCAIRESVMQTLLKEIEERPMYPTNLGQAPAQQWPSPPQEPTMQRRHVSGASPSAIAPGVRPHPHYRLSGLALYGSCMAAYKGGLWQFPILLASKPTILGYKQIGRAPFTTHTTIELSVPPLVFFTIFSSFIWSKASFIGELKPLRANLV